MTVRCDGSNSTYITECPNRLQTPSCRVISAMGKCSLVSFTSDRVICSCDICSATDTIQRRRLTLLGSIAYEVTGMIKFIYEDYVTCLLYTSDAADE